MKVLLTLDYELYFGSVVGTPQVSMIGATDKLLKILDQYNAKCVFFVDATYLLKLSHFAKSSPALVDDYNDVVGHIKFLESQGHQIQLHIHPHWMDSTYESGTWNIISDRYRLADWSKAKAGQIIAKSTDELNKHLENKVFAFRAGGWCIQPFLHIAAALQDSGITLDSTLFKGGRSQSISHSFDFSPAPDLDSWEFERDPCEPVNEGRFTEIAISSMKVSPFFYWRFAIAKIFGDKKIHGSFGDGSAIKNSKKDTIRMMTKYSNSVVSVDGFKSSLLLDSYKKALRNENDYFVAIGHPKALTEYSLKNIREWLSYMDLQGTKLEVY